MNLVANIQYNISTAGTDQRPSITSLNDNLFLTYYSNGTFDGQTSKGGDDIILVKLDKDLNILGNLQYTINTNNTDRLPHIQSIYGNIYLTYRTDDNLDGQINKGIQDIVLIKFDENLNILGNLQYSISTDYIDDLPQLNYLNGNIYLSYSTYGNLDVQQDKGGIDILLFKIDQNLNILGNVQYNISTDFDDYIGGSGPVLTTLNENLYLSYITDGNFEGQQNKGDSDVVLLKIDQNLNVLGNLQYNISTTDFEHSSHLTNLNGYIYLALSTYGNIDGHENVNTQDMTLFKIDENLNIINSIQEIISTNNAEGNPFIYGYNNFIYLGFATQGSFNEIPNDNQDVALFKLDENLNIIDRLQNTISTPNYDYRPSITGIDDYIYITYHTEQGTGEEYKGNRDIRLLKIFSGPAEIDSNIALGNILTELKIDNITINSIDNSIISDLEIGLFNEKFTNLNAQFRNSPYINIIRDIHRNEIKKLSNY
jgi:hypothetical protein